MTTPDDRQRAADEQKRAAAEAAAALVEDGMVVGLGTGSTAAHAIAALGRRVEAGLKIVGIPTSERSAAQARSLGIELTDFASHPTIDLTIDGADEIEPATLDLVKGLGGALLREKIVALASLRVVIVGDAGKLAHQLCSRAPLPVEIVPFGAEVTLRRLAELGSGPVLRRGRAGEPFVSDGGNHIADCGFPPLEAPGEVAKAVKSITGVVDHGLFIGIASDVLIGEAAGVRHLRPQ